MTRDEIRSLIGGYATGSLSAAERQALHEAALDDQELFDELAREQSLKELLEDPGVKTRLLAALAPRPQQWWGRAWVWAAAGAFAIAVIAGVVLLRTPPRQELARVIAPPAPTIPTPAPIAPAPAPKLATGVPPAPPSPPPAAPAPRLPPIAPTIPAPAPIAPAPAPRLDTGAPPAPPSPRPAAPAAPAAQPKESASAGALGAVSGGAVGGGGGGGGGRGGAARPLARAALARFAFDYSVTPEGALRIVPAANGFLTVGANNGTSMSVLFSSRPVQARSITEVPLPADCVSALVLFSAREMPPAFQNITGDLDAPSGTKSDPNPTADSVLIAFVPVRR